MIETPFFFLNAGHSLFGILHEPAPPSSQLPFVFCHPFGEEKLWSHRVFVTFARRLASQGHAVLRFDFMGNGDSDGDFSTSTLSTACSDVRAAIAEVRRQTGASQVGLLGLRLGATIASLVAEDAPDVRSLVLWSPITDGSRYAQELLRTNLTTQMATIGEVRQDREALVAAMKDGGAANIEGYDLTHLFYSEMCAIKLAAAQKRHAGPCLVVQIDRTAGRVQADLQQLVERYGDATLATVQEEPFWKEIARFYDEAPKLYSITLDWQKAARDR